MDQQVNEQKFAKPAFAFSFYKKGIGRLAFLIILLNTIALNIAFNLWFDMNGRALDSTARIWIFLALIAVVGVLPRARNMGMHPAKVLLIFVPIANLILFIRCLVYQEGYEASRKIDKTGKLIASIIAIISLSGYILIYHDALYR